MNDIWKILLVDDSEDDFILARAMLEDVRRGLIQISWAYDCEEGLKALEENGHPDVLLVDYLLGSQNGIDFIRAARDKGCRAPAIMLTGFSGSRATDDAVEAGVTDYLDKNHLSGPMLERTIRFALERQRLLDTLENSNHELERRVAERTRDLEESNRALRDANTQIEKLLSSTHMHIVYLDRDFNFIRVNRRYAEGNDKPEEYFIGKNHFEMFPNPEYQAIFQSVLDTGQPYTTFARPFVHPEAPELGVTYWDWHLIPLTEDDGSVSGLIMSLMDVTEQQRDRQALGYQAYLLENVSDAIVATDGKMRLSAWNHAAESIFGWKRSEVLGKDVFSVLHTEFEGRPTEEVMQEVTEYGVYEGYARNLHRKGQYIPVEIRITRLLDPQGNPSGFVSIQRDITRRLEVEEEARQVRRRLETQAEMTRLLGGTRLDHQKMLDITAKRAAELVGDACVITRMSPDGRSAIPAAYYHTNPDGLKHLKKMLPKMAIPLGQGVVGTVAQTGKPLLIPVLEEEPNVELLPESVEYAERFGVHSLLVVPILSNEKVIGTLGITRDRPGRPYTTDDQLFLEAMAGRAGLWTANAELFAEVQRELAERKRVQMELNEIQTRLMEGAEEERLLLARELHDGPIQDLYGLEFQLHGLADLMPDGADDETMTAMRASIQSVIESLRGMTMALRPPTLTRLGLGAALHSHVDQMRKVDHGLKIQLDLDSEKENPIPERARLALFRIAQVALTNVVRHAQAQKVVVRLRIRPQQIRLEVEDDGTGFVVPRRWIQLAREGHLGLVGAKERVDALNGRIEIISAPGKGTKIRVTVPVETEAAQPA